jgi:hypothetical protein
VNSVSQRPGSVTHTRRHAAYLAPPSSEAESFDRLPSSSGSLAKMAAPPYHAIDYDPWAAAVKAAASVRQSA